MIDVNKEIVFGLLNKCDLALTALRDATTALRATAQSAAEALAKPTVAPSPDPDARLVATFRQPENMVDGHDIELLMEAIYGPVTVTRGRDGWARVEKQEGGK